jgi:NAD(P)-dependent dehydrogenase (short-subunit alcohol dehydrogenase family)
MRGHPNPAGCTKAKAGMLGLSRTLARVLGGRNIRVSAAVPGTIVTNRQAKLRRDAAAGQALVDAQCPEIRLNRGHVARVTLFMVSGDSDDITVQDVLIDAGIAQCSAMS